MTKEEGLGKKPLHIVEKTRLGVTRMIVIALVVIIVVVVIVAAYIVLQPPSRSPTRSTMPYTHTVNWTTMANYQTDFWNITMANSYTVTLNDSMTVSSGDQYLLISALNGGSSVWSVTYLTSTTYQIGGNSTIFNCANGLVTVTVNGTSITFTGTSSYTKPVSFQSLSRIKTANGDGNFNGGELYIKLTIT